MAALASPARLCAVVKSNAYGHGLEAAARTLADAGVEGLGFAVFTASEGLALRRAGIKEAIIVVGPVADSEIAEAGRTGLELAILDDDDPERFAPHRPGVHVKVETGIHRFGVARDRAARVIERCRGLGLAVAGIYSHLANAEDLDYEYTMKQVEALKSIDVQSPSFARRTAISSSVAPTLRQDPVRHIAASAAAMLWPETRLDMVRCGIALYGFWPSNEVRRAMAQQNPQFPLQQALRWCAPVVQTRLVAPGEPVGYGCAFVPNRETQIAVLAVGYADGVPRAAGEGRARAFFDRRGTPIVGRVCMNALMVDVTELTPQPRSGDIAQLDVEDLATAAGTINYEILARLSPELERRYL